QRRGADYPYTGVACRDTSVPTLLDVADAAPSWQTDGQDDYWGSTYVGHTSSQSASQQTTSTKKVGRSYTISTGAGIDAKLLGIETKVEFEHGWDASDSTSLGRDHSVDIESGLENNGATTAGKMTIVDYRCFYYEVYSHYGVN